MSDIERHFDKVVKILARVSGGSTEGERAAAARLTAEYLAAHPMPIRWFVRKGTKVRVVPSHEMQDLTRAHRIIRDVQMPGNKWYSERDRVKDDDELALNAGYLYFTQHGFALFVPVSGVEARL